MKLQTLRLSNFKGAKEFNLDAQGGDVVIYGDNGSGKTTVADALCWLLFDKDYSGKSDFEIKTLTPNGEPIHHLNHEVEGVFDLGTARGISLKKVYQEKWTKKRGASQAEFSGHTTDYFIDDVPVQKKEYVARVSEIATEDLFRLLTSPIYFAHDLHWEKRREILLEVCGDVSNEEVIEANPDLTSLMDILKTRSQENHIKVVKATMSKINDQLKQIPVRIDEVQKGLSVSESIDIAAEEKKLAEIRQVRESLVEERMRIKNSGQGAELKRRIAELDAEIARAKSDYERGIRAQADELDRQIRELTAEISDARREGARVEVEIENLKSIDEPDIAAFDGKMQELRDEWQKVNESRYCYEETICPTCGQAMPEDPDAEAKFEDRKARRLAEINAQGVDLKKRKEHLIAEHEQKLKDRGVLIKEREGVWKSLAQGIEKAEAKIMELAPKRDELARQLTLHPQSAEYQRLSADRIDLSARLNALETGESTAELARIDADLTNLDTTPIEDRILAAKEAERAKARVKELQAELKKLSAEYDRLAGELHMLERFTEAKVRLLEDKAAAHFSLARFKLFEKQINGGLNPCCEVLYEGVPYGTNLNNGARINVGLDIINALSKHYGASLPIIIDNAESVTELIPVNAQVIRLVVSEGDDALRVECEARKEAA